MQFDNLEKIIGVNCREVMLYGFFINPIFNLEDFLKENKFIVNTYENKTQKFPNKIPYNKENAKKRVSRECKNGIVNLILENYRRSKLNDPKEPKEPLIPLLFVVGFTHHENNFKNKELDVARIANKSEDSSVTIKELRQCERLRTEVRQILGDELGKELEEIINQTLKFITITKTKKHHYILNQVKPFWEMQNWSTLWQNRIASRKIDENKPYAWRKEFSSVITLFNQSQDVNHENNNNNVINTPSNISQSKLVQ